MLLETRALREADTARVELYHCASMHGTYEQQRATIDRLHALEAGDLVDEVAKQAWAHRLTPEAEDDWCQRARRAHEAFREWATEHGRSLEPGFGSKTVSPIGGDESYEVVSFPVLCLAVYADGDLVCVAPSTDPVTGETWTVQDCLAQLEADADVEPATAPSGSTPGA